jgi:hypothetical protein
MRAAAEEIRGALRQVAVSPPCSPVGAMPIGRWHEPTPL